MLSLHAMSDKLGRVLALDLGEKRIGVALSDETRLLASSHTVIQRSSRKVDFSAIDSIVQERGVTQIVVGLPLQHDGSDGAIARWVRDYAADLSDNLNIPYVLWDESFTTRQAQASMRSRGKKAKKQRQWVDAVAAAFILQSYLDAQLDGKSFTF